MSATLRESGTLIARRAGNAAAAGGAIIYLIFYLPYYFIIPRYDDLNWSLMMTLCIDLVVTMSFGCVQIAAFERSGEPCSLVSLLLMCVCMFLFVVSVVNPSVSQYAFISYMSGSH